MSIPLNIDWQQILLHIFNFAILTGGLYFILYSPIKKFIEKREAYYRKINDETNEKLASAQALEEHAKKQLEEIDREIADKRLKAEEEVRQHTDQQLKQTKARADKMIAEAVRAAEAEKQAILERADKDIINMTKAATAKIVHSSTDEAYKQFLEIAERDVEHGK